MCSAGPQRQAGASDESSLKFILEIIACECRRKTLARPLASMTSSSPSDAIRKPRTRRRATQSRLASPERDGATDREGSPSKDAAAAPSVRNPRRIVPTCTSAFPRAAPASSASCLPSRAFAGERHGGNRDHAAEDDVRRSPSREAQCIQFVPVPASFFAQPPCPPASRSGAPPLSRSENAYLDKLPQRERESLLRELDRHTRGGDETPLRFRVLRSTLANKQSVLERLRCGADGAKGEQWVESALRLPTRAVAAPSPSRLPQFLAAARATMDQEIYGQEHLKERTLLALAAWVCNPDATPLTLGLEGVPGTGKTSYARALGRIMGRPCRTINLGGLNDVSVLLGHSFSYQNATYGRLAAALMECGTTSPVLVFDELDKLATDGPRAQEIASLLMHITDPQASARVEDNYFGTDVPLDLSKATLVFTMNDASRVSPALLDRLSMVRMQTPGIEEKFQIARKHIIPRELRRLHCDSMLEFNEEAVRRLVRERASNEATGVRELSRDVRYIVETLNVTRRGGSAMLRVGGHGELSRKRPRSAHESGCDDGAPVVEKTCAEQNEFRKALATSRCVDVRMVDALLRRASEDETCRFVGRAGAMMMYS